MKRVESICGVAQDTDRRTMVETTQNIKYHVEFDEDYINFEKFILHSQHFKGS